MKSDPQLREDVRRLQARVLQLEADLIAAKSATRTVEKIVEKPVRVIVDRVIEKPVTVTVEKIVEKPIKVRVVEYQDSPETVKALARANDTIGKLRARAPEIVERAVIEYRDDPKTARALEKALAEIKRLKSLPPVEKVVKVPVIKEITKYVDRVVMTGAGAS